jgi:hypothetical protein
MPAHVVRVDHVLMRIEARVIVVEAEVHPVGARREQPVRARGS